MIATGWLVLLEVLLVLGVVLGLAVRELVLLRRDRSRRAADKRDD